MAGNLLVSASVHTGVTMFLSAVLESSAVQPAAPPKIPVSPRRGTGVKDALLTSHETWRGGHRTNKTVFLNNFPHCRKRTRQTCRHHNPAGLNATMRWRRGGRDRCRYRSTSCQAG